MALQLLYFFILLSSFILMVVFLDFLQKKNIAKGEVTRKMGHLILGGILIVQPCVFTNIFLPIILCTTISIIIFLSSKKNKLACADNVQRRTHGTYLYPMGVLATFLLAYFIDRIDLFYPSILVLIISDIISAFTGNYYMKKKTFGHNLNQNVLHIFNKTLYGSSAFFISTFIILAIYFRQNILSIILISFLITVAEFFSSKGFDNVTIPIATLLGLFFLL